LCDRALDEALGVFLVVDGGDDGGADEGDIDLAAVRVAGEDEADARVVYFFDVVGVMGEEDDGVARGGASESGGEVLDLLPVIAYAAEPEAGATGLDPEAAVGELRDARGAEGLADVGFDVVVVIVIAKDGVDAEGGVEAGELVDAGLDPGDAAVRVIATEKDKVGVEGVGGLDDVADVGDGDVGTVMEIGEEGDGFAFEGSGEIGNC